MVGRCIGSLLPCAGKPAESDYTHMRRVALVVVHFRTIADTLECLASALALTVPAGSIVKIILVDNASNDGSWDRLVQWACRRKLFWRALLDKAELPGGVDLGIGFRFGDSDAEIVLLRSERNDGYAAGCNLGIQFALAEPATTDFWILNSDVLFEQEALQQLLAASDGRAPAVYGSTLLYQDDPGTIQAAGGAVYWPLLGRSRHRGKGQRIDRYPRVARHLDYIVGAAMFFSRHVIESVGLFPESLFLYFEETEWCARARERGYEMVWVPESRVVHKEGKSTGAGDRFRKLSNLSFRYMVRNSLLFSHARYRFGLPTVMLWNCGESIWYWIKGDRKKFNVFLNAVREYWGQRSSLTI